MMSVCKMFTFADENNFEEFEISGSTYEPVGDIFNGGKKVKGADYVALEEMATISIMCNDSALDFNEFKNIFEKVGEATETALITLGERSTPTLLLSQVDVLSLPRSCARILRASGRRIIPSSSPETGSPCPLTVHQRSPLALEMDQKCLLREHQREFLIVALM